MPDRQQQKSHNNDSKKRRRKKREGQTHFSVVGHHTMCTYSRSKCNVSRNISAISSTKKQQQYFMNFGHMHSMKWKKPRKKERGTQSVCDRPYKQGYSKEMKPLLKKPFHVRY